MWGALTWHFHCHAMDMLGFGLSDKPKGHHYLITQQAEAQLALLTSRGVRQVHLFAHDYGVSVAQELLARQHEGRIDGIKIKSVVFLNGGLFPAYHRARLGQKLLASRFGPVIAGLMTKKSFARSFGEIFGTHTQPSRAEINGFWSLITRQHGKAAMAALIDYIAQRKANEARWVEPLEHPIVPMRLINGADDPVSGRHMAEAWQRLVPNADCVVLNGIGHYPQIEAPKEVFRALMDFHLQHS